MDFVAIDFETANPNRSSACAIGIVTIENGRVIDEFYSLINPNDQFNQYNVNVHGITQQMVKDSPDFPRIWLEIKRFFGEKIVVAHNASFDMNVLKSCLDLYGISYPDIAYVCSFLLSQKVWPDLDNYRLQTLANSLQLDHFKHHDALHDARVASSVFKEIIRTTNKLTYDDICNQYEYRMGSFSSNNRYTTFSSLASKSKRIFKNKIKAIDIVATSDVFDFNHPLYGKNIVFTGDFDSMDRHEAMQKVADLGGVCRDGVTKITHYLVVGLQDFVKLKDGVKSGKVMKAEKLELSGTGIKIISEQDFLEML
jgi:DNA polymerase-3 subunit epsilon